MPERIKLEGGNPDAWVCICGNMPSEDGFFPCDEDGMEVEPVDGEWDGVLYVCNKCGRVINQDTLFVMGRALVGDEVYAPVS